MIRLSKLADYAIVLLAEFCGEERAVLTARKLAEVSGLPMPTVSKVMKALGKQGLVVSQRGAQGGYQLARPPQDISVVEVITAMEGPIGLTACSAAQPKYCEIQADCPVKDNWQRISARVLGALADLNLMDMRPQDAERSRPAVVHH